MKIIRTSRYAADILNTHTGGTVHSVYRRTINLSLDGQLLAVQAYGSPLSPISLLTDAGAPELDTPGITVGTPFIIENTSLLFLSDQVPPASDGHRQVIAEVPFHCAPREDLFLSPVNAITQSSDPSGALHVLADEIRDILREESPDGFPGIFRNDPEASGDLVRLAAAKRLNAASEAIAAGNAAAAAEELSSLIGVGTGLTPSGDDFLTGVLAGLRLCGITPAREPSISNGTNTVSDASSDNCSLIEASAPGLALLLCAKIQSRMRRTGDISRAFLLCALEGQFSEAVVQLAKIPSSDSICRMFRAIGHSSGLDTLCGVYFSLSGSSSLG